MISLRAVLSAFVLLWTAASEHSSPISQELSSLYICAAGDKGRSLLSMPGNQQPKESGEAERKHVEGIIRKNLKFCKDSLLYFGNGGFFCLFVICFLDFLFCLLHTEHRVGPKSISLLSLK